MTPKEKAKRIVEGFYPYVRLAMGQEDYKERAKQCALIAIDLLIKANPIAFDEDDNCIASNWWEQVKKEIEAL